MRIGVVFPQTEIGQDPAAMRDYAQAVESMGYTHIPAFDSVVGANPNRPGGWEGSYTYQHAFHEPFVPFGDHRAGIFSGLKPMDQPPGAARSFGEGHLPHEHPGDGMTRVTRVIADTETRGDLDSRGGSA